jgi:hypothetical protein
MRIHRVAALTAAAVTTGLFTVGCGPLPSSGKIDTSGLAKASQKVGDAVSKASEKVGEVSDLATKLKAATDDISKELDPLKKAFETLKEKITAGEKDAGMDPVKQKAVGLMKEVKDKAEGLIKEITEKFGGLAGLKDLTSLEDAKKKIMEVVEKLKPLLKDYLPK